MMWTLVVLTVFVLSSTVNACYKAVQIENKLDDRKVSSAISNAVLSSYAIKNQLKAPEAPY